jgi:ankyrin repeat protein
MDTLHPDFEDAVSNDDLDRLEALLVTHDGSKKDLYGRSLFAVACYYNSWNAAKIILAANPDHLNLPCESGRTPWLYLFTNRHVSEKFADWLLEQGVDIHAVDFQGEFALMYAAHSGDTRAVQYLYDKGANLFGRDLEGRTVLMAACEGGELDTAKFIAALMADKFQEQLRLKTNTGKSLLFCPCKWGYLSTVQWLFDAGLTDVNTLDKNGANPLHDTCAYGSLRTAEWLVSVGVNIHVQDTFGKTPFMRACQHDHLPMAQWLFSKGADIHPRNWFGHTALLTACKYDSYDVAEWLLEIGANIHDQDRHGDTAMFFACESENVRMMELLLKHGAGTRDLNQGKPLLQCTLQFSHFKAATWLLLHGAITNGDGFIDLDFDLRPHKLSLKSHFVDLFQQREGFLCLLPGLYSSMERKRKRRKANGCLLPRLLQGKYRVLSLVADFAGVARGRELRIARQVWVYMASL